MTQSAHENEGKTIYLSQNSPPDPQAETVNQPWKRQKGEPGLWWRRFCIYRDLGAQRSLQAAAAKEREKMRVLNGTKAEKKAEQKKPRVDVSVNAPAHLQEVPKPKPPQAPGSWKVASINWHWVERCQAFDEHLIDEVVTEQLKVLADGPALAFNRIQCLMKMYDSLADTYSTFKGSYHDLTALAGRLQSVLRDIREEMAQFDEPFTRAVLQMHMKKLYNNLDTGDGASVKAEIERRKKKALERARTK